MNKYSVTVPSQAAPLRLDRALPLHIGDLSREKARKLIRIGAVWINDRRVQVQSRLVNPGDTMHVYIGREGYEQRYETARENILFEDDWLLFYRKEPGIPTQGIICDSYNNVYAGLLRYCRQSNRTSYLGLHHRLDIETSGVMLFTKSRRVNRSIHYQFASRRARKEYCAVVCGSPDFTVTTVSTFISKRDGSYYCSDRGPGKHAETTFTIAASYHGRALVRALLHTGRTHQVRLQLAHIGLPVMGDGRYGSGRSDNAPRCMLHAETLTIVHPIHKHEVTVKADLFPDMEKLISRCEQNEQVLTDSPVTVSRGNDKTA